MSRAFLITLSVVLASVAATGCKSSCRQLSEKLCDCARNTLDRDACLRRASAEEGRIPMTAADQATCANLLPHCDCNLIDTPDGKRRCGLAR